MVKKINEKDGVISLEQLNSFGNISKIKSSLSNESFEKLIDSFGEGKSEAIDLISIVLYKDRTKLSDLGELSIHIDKILNYDERDFLDKNIQKAITTLFMKKIAEIAKDDEKVREIFEANFGETSKIKEHKFLIKDLMIKVSELDEIFPDIIKSIRVNNTEMWQELNKLGFSINSISSFEKQNLSDQKIICELLFWQNKEAISKYGSFENDIKMGIKETNIGLENLEKNRIDDDCLEKVGEKNKAYEEGDIESVDKINKELWKKKIDRMEQDGENPKKIKILEKLVGNNFDFESLSNVEQNIFIKEYSQKFLGKLKENKFLKLLNVDTDEYETFWNDLLDFQKKEHQIEIHLLDGRDIKLNVKKYFEKGEQRKFLDPENFEKFEDLEIVFDINIDDNNDEIIDLLESKKNVIMSGGANHNGKIYSYTSKNGELRIGDDYDLSLEGVKLNMSQMNDFFEKDEEELKNILVEYGLWEGNKNIFEEVIKNKKTMNRIKNGETCIFKEMLEKMDLQILSRNIKLDASNVSKLSDLFVFGTADQEEIKKASGTEQEEKFLNNMSEYRGDLENIKNVAKEIFEQLEYDAYEGDLYANFDDFKAEYNKLTNIDKESLEREIRELIDESDDENVKNLGEELLEHFHGSEKIPSSVEGEDVKEVVETEEEKFMKAWESLKGFDFDGSEDKGFRVGTRLFINGGGSKLPPLDQRDSFFEFEISDISEYSFQVKVIGNEHKSDEAGKTFWLPKTQEHLEKMKSSGEIFKVEKLNKNDRDSSLKNIGKSKVFDKISIFGSKEGQVKIKNGKLTNNEGEEIKYFGRSTDIRDPNTGGQNKSHTTYEVKSINNSKGTVKLVCNFEGQDENDLSKFVNYTYNNELSFEKFILLIEGKKLRGYSEKEQKERTAGTNLTGHSGDRKIKFFSLASIFGGFKNGFKKVNEFSKKLKEEQQGDFENLLYSKEGLDLYGKLGLLFSSEALDRAQLEFYNDRQNRVWKKIEYWYKLYESDPHFGSMRGDQIAKRLEAPGYVGKDKDRHKTAAAFLLLMKKDGPYKGKLIAQLGKGHWVEKFLGPEHKVRFQKMVNERKRELEDPVNTNPHRLKTRQDELNRLEFDYISGVIDARAPFIVPEEENMRANHIWSRKFAETLDENSKTYFSSYKEKANSLEGVSFRLAEQEYFRLISSGRPQKALPYLKRMMEDAQNKDEQSRAKSYFLGAMLTGIIKNTQEATLRNDFWAIARTMGLLPGIWCRDTNQASKVQNLLDGITGQAPFEKFSAKTKYKKDDYEHGTFNENNVKLGFLTKDWPQYWKMYGEKILDIIEFRDMNSPNSIINLAEKAEKNGETSNVFKDIINFSRESTKEDINKNVSYTYSYYTNSPWTANKGVVDGLVPRNGEYKGKETIEIEASQEFWKSVGQNFNTGKLEKKGAIEFYIGKFRNRFDDARDQSSVNFMMRGLALVKKLKQEGKNDEAKYNLWYLIKGNLHEKIGSFPPEFGVVVDKFLDFFDNNIDMVDDKMIQNTFGSEAAISFKDPYGMLGWKNFYDKYMAYEGFGGSKEKTQYQRTFKRNEENYINWKIDNISKNLKRKGISGQPTVISYSEQEVEHKSGFKSRIAA